MKVNFVSGCMSYDSSFDDKSIMMSTVDEVFEKTLYLVKHLPNPLDKDTYIDMFRTLMQNCKSSKLGSEIKYGDDEKEIICVDIINTKNHRIRVFDEYISYETFAVIDDKHSNYIKGEELNDILIEVLEEYKSNPLNGGEEILLTLNGIVSDIVGIVGDISECYHCEQCGDSVYTYELIV